jgi:hypothetical protein
MKSGACSHLIKRIRPSRVAPIHLATGLTSRSYVAPSPSRIQRRLARDGQTVGSVGKALLTVPLTVLSLLWRPPGPRFLALPKPGTPRPRPTLAGRGRPRCSDPRSSSRTETILAGDRGETCDGSSPRVRDPGGRVSPAGASPKSFQDEFVFGPPRWLPPTAHSGHVLTAVPAGGEPVGFAGGGVVRPPSDCADVAAVDVDPDGGFAADGRDGMDIVGGAADGHLPWGPSGAM